MTQYIDLTHTFTDLMPVYPGDPTPELVQTSHFEKTGHNNFSIKSGLHVGTHIDAPLHMINGGKKLSEMPIEKFFGRGKLLDCRGQQTIGAEVLDQTTIEAGDIVLLFTGFGEKFRNPDYYQNYPVMSEALTHRLIERKIKMIGMDTPSPDRAPYTIHKLLLQKEILIIENLTNLETLLHTPQFEVIALPAKFDVEAAPIRVVAKIA